MTEHLTLAELLEAVEVIDAHIDASAAYQGQPLARTWTRVTKCCEEAGELRAALSAGDRAAVLDEAGDVISAALCAIQHLTKDAAATWAAFSAALDRAYGRRPMARADPLTVGELVETIALIDAHLVEPGEAATYCEQPLARYWERMTRPSAAAGNAWKALSRWTGENYRKGVCGTKEEVLAALGAVAVEGLLAIQFLTKDKARTWAVVSAAFSKARDRVRVAQS
jgi:hypothetical protein